MNLGLGRSILDEDLTVGKWYALMPNVRVMKYRAGVLNVQTALQCQHFSPSEQCTRKYLHLQLYSMPYIPFTMHIESLKDVPCHSRRRKLMCLTA